MRTRVACLGIRKLARGRGTRFPVRLPYAAGAALCCLLAASCGGGLLSELGRPLGDPSTAAPAVASFIAENRVEVSWPVDVNTDQFILERAADAAALSFQAVYTGTDTTYTDTQCSDQERYLYRLTRTRGTRSFGPSEAVMGVASSVCRDSLEPNDQEAAATPLGSTLAANLYYYCSLAQPAGVSLVQQDVDWYAVSVPAHRQANIVVTQGSLAGGSVSTWMYFYLKGANPVQIVNNQAIPLPNYADQAVSFRFKVYPVPSSFTVGGGGSLITYTISLNSITSLP